MPKSAEGESSLVATFPTFRELFPDVGNIGERKIEKIIKDLYLRDCLLILSKLSRHCYKYCHQIYEGDGLEVYRGRCFELLDAGMIKKIKAAELSHGQKYGIIFLELSVLYLIKMCLKYCDDSDYTKTKDFPINILNNIGKCLLIANSVLADQQLSGVSDKSSASEELLVNFTRQLIVDKN